MRPSMVSAKCIRGGVGPVFEPVSNFFQESQQLLQRLDTLCKNGRLSRSGSRVRTIFESFSNFFRTPISPEDLFEPVSNFFRNPSNYPKGLTHFATMAVSVVQVLGFDPFSNRFRTFFKHNCRARVHPPFSCASHVQCQDASHVQCQVPLRGILLFLVGGEGGATGGEPSPGARGGPCAACDCPPTQGPAQKKT